MHCRWYPSMPCSRSPGWGCYPSMPCRFPGPHPVGGVEGDLAGGVSWSIIKGEVEGLSGWGVYMPTTKGEVEGDLAWGSPGPHPRGKLRGIWPGGSPGPQPGMVCSKGGCLLCGDVEISPWWLLLRAVRILLECILVFAIMFLGSETKLSESVLRLYHFWNRLNLTQTKKCTLYFYSQKLKLII